MIYNGRGESQAQAAGDRAFGPPGKAVGPAPPMTLYAGTDGGGVFAISMAGWATFR